MADENRKRTSMSVPEMGAMLGLGRTESYWLIKKHYFQTITVGGKIRVLIASFEDWYSNQTKYKKVDGTPPGTALQETTLSAKELGELLGLAEMTAYELIAKGYFEFVPVLGRLRITKASFERWYSSQSHYKTIDDQKKDWDILATTYSLPEIRRMLGTHRNNVYHLVSSKQLEVVMVGRQKRVPKQSFDTWFASQNKYKKVMDADEAERS